VIVTQVRFSSLCASAWEIASNCAEGESSRLSGHGEVTGTFYSCTGERHFAKIRQILVKKPKISDFWAFFSSCIVGRPTSRPGRPTQKPTHPIQKPAPWSRRGHA